MGRLEKRANRIGMNRVSDGAEKPLAATNPACGDDTLVLLLVDGECAMCGGIARFAAGRDRAERLRFAALDSAAGRELRSRLGIVLPPGGSFALVRGTKVWTRSAAAMRALSALNAPWPAVAAALRLVPARLRDAVYDAVAARRHRLAGPGLHCPAVLDERLRRRLLEDGAWGGQSGPEAAKEGGRG